MKFNNTKFRVAFKKHFGMPPYTNGTCDGVARTVMYKIFNEGNPNRDHYAILCKAMNLPMESFFTSK